MALALTFILKLPPSHTLPLPRARNPEREIRACVSGASPCPCNPEDSDALANPNATPSPSIDAITRPDPQPALKPRSATHPYLNPATVHRKHMVPLLLLGPSFHDVGVRARACVVCIVSLPHTPARTTRPPPPPPLDSCGPTASPTTQAMQSAPLGLAI